MRNAFQFKMSDLLESHLLHLFVELAEHGNMQRAAKAVSLTPSALSHALKRLERDLDCRLFDRQGRGMVLSSQGRQFLPEAKALLEQIRSTRHRFGSRVNWRSGRLRIGSTGAGCNYILPEVIREYRDSFPDVSIRIAEGSVRSLVESLRGDEIDFAVCACEHEYAGVTRIPLAKESMVFLVNPMHPWAKTGRAVRSEIGMQKLILSEADSENFEAIDHYFRADRIQVEPFIEVRSEALIKKLVELDLGIAVLPKWIADDEIREGRLVAFPPGKRELNREWCILHTRKHQLNFAETLFTGLTGMVVRHKTNP